MANSNTGMGIPDPIIQHFTDNDFYKFLMGQLAWKKHRDAQVRWRFICRRSDAKLAKVVRIEELREELAHARTIHLRNTERHFLGGTYEYGSRMFADEYLADLMSLSMPDIDIEDVDGDLHIEVNAPWFPGSFWEITTLSIVSELYFRARLRALSVFERDAFVADMKLRLEQKIKELRTRPDIRFSEFGTRRRAAFWWQDYVVGALSAELPKQFLGTSNTYLASKHGVTPMGTNAHELQMVYSGMFRSTDEEMRDSQHRVYEDWQALYGNPLMIALPDTFTTDFFLRTATEDFAVHGRGFRQDSGDEIEEGEKYIRFYERFGVDPRTKLVVFSNNLRSTKRVFEIQDHFQGRIQTSFGIGKWLTFDARDVVPDIVMKPIEVNGVPIVKLSNDAGKVIGDPATVARYQRVFLN